MEIFNKIIKLDSSVIALGFFDGVHNGHRILLNKLNEEAIKHHTKSVLITFQKSPAEYFISNTEYILSNSQKEEIITTYNIDYLIELDFGTLIDMSAEEYLEFLISNLAPKTIITGANHTFGKSKKGTPEMLSTYSSKYNYNYIEIPLLMENDDIVSSTLIKQLLSKGDIKRANKLLGYEFKISGKVIKGNQIGRTIGFPTANILYPTKIVQIPFGVYTCKVNILDKEYKGILNFGLKPTVGTKSDIPLVEVHILNFDSDIYGEMINILITDRIRAEKKFNSLEELQKQIKEDLSKC